ncbi:putative RNA-binding protein NOB1 [Septoria linicola]|nr:putative RNA-binding protein NOB1 [Septoria linicola]
MATDKPVHTVVLDTGAIIKNEPPVSTLLSQAENLITVPAIISEIKDAATRLRVETTLKPFLTIRSPNPTSIKFVTDFARKTGDLSVLSKPDIQIIALTYEIECERNGGDWRLRKVPGQKGLNGAPPTKDVPIDPVSTQDGKAAQTEQSATDALGESAENLDSTGETQSDEQHAESQIETREAEQLTSQLQSATIEDSAKEPSTVALATDSAQDSTEPSAQSESESDSDSDGWITPSNLKKKQAEDSGASSAQTPEPKTMQVGVLTSDFAMQNVILQMNLNLLSPSMSRIKNLKTYVLRCHACFNVSKDLSKQFCTRCGQPALTRVSCSINANGEFKLHLKKNMQWNNRGNRYSVPKPVHGTANGKNTGGGKQGWGHDLILAEDQKEYERATAVEKRTKERSLMDEDYLPSILTGDRNKTGGRTRVGAGRNVNSRKR